MKNEKTLVDKKKCHKCENKLITPSSICGCSFGDMTAKETLEAARKICKTAGKAHDNARLAREYAIQACNDAYDVYRIASKFRRDAYEITRRGA